MRGCVGAWARGRVDAWARGCVGLWVRGRVGRKGRVVLLCVPSVLVRACVRARARVSRVCERTGVYWGSAWHAEPRLRGVELRV